MDRHTRAKDVQFRRMAGASKETAQAIHDQFRKADDLRTTCPKCGMQRRGSWEHVTAPCPKCEGRK